MSYNKVVCILAAGTGSRVQPLSNDINKVLFPLDNKAVIDHIISKFSEDYEIIIAIGYKGEMVREYCNVTYPNRNIKFVEIDKFEGEGTGPSYSINQCKAYLQRPFIWVVGDIFIPGNIPALDRDWLGVSLTNIPELYSTVKIKNNKIISFKNKDKKGYPYAFVGLANVYDYQTFWKELDVNSGEIVSAYYNIRKYKNMLPIEIDWHDTGCIDSYIRAKKFFDQSKKYDLPKINGEFLYKSKNKIIKLSKNKQSIHQRIQRSKLLKPFVPKLTFKGSHLFAYQWVNGQTLYEVSDLSIWKNFLVFAKKNLWKPENKKKANFKKFYYDKTFERLTLFLKNRDSNFNDQHTVNGINTPPIHVLLDQFKWETLYDGLSTKLFHGDMQFDNIIYTTDQQFSFIDWRQDFAGSDIGDVYYDLAKLYGGILLSYKFIKNKDTFSCVVNQNTVEYRHSTDQNLCKFQPIFEQWVQKNEFDLHKIKSLAALIWLNMAPLHEREVGDLLFFKSKQLLEKLTH